MTFVPGAGSGGSVGEGATFNDDEQAASGNSSNSKHNPQGSILDKLTGSSQG